LSKDAPVKSYTCNNASCKKVFDKPIKLLDMQKTQEPYSACPFCLTPISSEDNVLKVEKIENPDQKGMQPDSSEKPQDCPYHFGYLSEQSSKKGYPDPCLVCSMLMKCMSAKSKT
jgi:hypothetical protein